LGHREEPTEVPVTFCDEAFVDALASKKPIQGVKGVQNTYFLKKPTTFLTADADGIQTSSNGVKSPQWAQMQFVLG
jgi:hypothetical protein